MRNAYWIHHASGIVLLADSHSPMLEGIRSLLDERFEVVVMVADVRSLLGTMKNFNRIW